MINDGVKANSHYVIATFQSDPIKHKGGLRNGLKVNSRIHSILLVFFLELQVPFNFGMNTTISASLRRARKTGESRALFTLFLLGKCK